jgi:hypothetical protein
MIVGIAMGTTWICFRQCELLIFKRERNLFSHMGTKLVFWNFRCDIVNIRASTFAVLKIQSCT